MHGRKVLRGIIFQVGNNLAILHPRNMSPAWGASVAPTTACALGAPMNKFDEAHKYVLHRGSSVPQEFWCNRHRKTWLDFWAFGQVLERPKTCTWQMEGGLTVLNPGWLQLDKAMACARRVRSTSRVQGVLAIHSRNHANDGLSSVHCSNSGRGSKFCTWMGDEEGDKWIKYYNKKYVHKS